MLSSLFKGKEGCPYFFMEKSFIRSFIVFIVILSLFTYPIIHANVYHMDDNGRVMYGYIDMLRSGRYLSQVLFLLINTSSYICDIAPLTQILSVILISAVLASISQELGYSRWRGGICLSFIACSPYFISNLAFRFDSLSMSLALVSALLPFCFVNKMRGTYKIWLINIISILVSLNFYQPAVNVFLVLMCLVALFKLSDLGIKESFIFFNRSVLGFVLAFVFYKVELSLLSFRELGAAHSYASTHSELVTSWASALGNFKYYMSAALSEFAKGALEHILGVGCVLGLLVLFVRIVKKCGWLYLPVTLFYILFAFFSLYGSLSLLENPIVSPRVIMANGAFFALAMTGLLGRRGRGESIWGKVGFLFAAYMLFLQIVLAFEWGNAARAQAAFEEQVGLQIVNDVYDMTKSQPATLRMLADEDVYKYLQAPMAESILKRHGSFMRKEMILWKTGLLWPSILLQEEGLQSNVSVYFTDDPAEPLNQQKAMAIRASCRYDHIVSRRHYNLYQVRDGIILDFDKVCPAL